MTAHLSEQDIRSYRRRALAPQDLLRASSHLAECGECRARIVSGVEAHAALQAIQQGIESEGISATHLSYEDIEGYVDKQLEEPELLRVEQHIHQCKHCSAEIREIKTLRRKLENRIAPKSGGEITGLGRRAQPNAVLGWLRHRYARIWVSAVGACSVAAIIVFRLSLLNSPEQVEKLLAQAYTENRNLELRVPYASHADFHQLKSGDRESLLTMPEPLTKAANEIRLKLKKNPDDPHWLILSARLDVLDWRYKSALETLRKIEPDLDSRDVRLTRALAVFEKAEMEHDQQAYGDVVDLMGQTLQSTPDDPVALFNQAVACEKLHMYDCASRNYEHLQKIEKDSGWAAEARERLNRIKAKQASRVMKLPKTQTVDRIPLEMDGGNAINGKQSEAYLEPVLEEWLASENPTLEVEHRSFKLAEALEQEHGDTWFIDFLKARRLPLANKLLQSAIKANHDGRTQQGEKGAELARAAFLRVKSIAGAARSEFEFLYALQRQSKAKECIQELPNLSQLLQGKKYRWLETQGLLERSSCEAMAGNFDPAWSSASEALDHARSFDYEALSLRALGYEAGLHTLEGRLPQSWRSNNMGLELFWNGTYPEDRGFQFYADLELAAEESNQLYLAAILQREALKMISTTGRADVSAIAQFRLGVLLGLLGLSPESETAINESYRLFRDLPASSSTSLYKSFCEILLADLKARRGARLVALEHLDLAKVSAAKASNFMLRLRYLNAYAEIARLGANDKEEEQLLEESVSIAREAYDTLRSEKDRWDWANTAGGALRRLFELKMQKPHAPADSLALWEGYRNQSPRTRSTTGSIAGNTPDNRVPINLNRAASSKLLVFAVLPKQTIVWVADQDQVREFHLPIQKSVLDKAVRNFYRLCSDPSSPLESVKKAGFGLYQQLLAPVQGAIGSDDSLLIEADGILGLVPWSALTIEDGVYLGQLHTITSSTTGLVDREPPHISISGARTLVAYPGSVEFQDEQFISLPEAEAEAEFVAKISPGTLYLHGKEANAETILRELPNSSVFYFSGHAAERAYGGELVVQGRNGGEVISASRLERANLIRTKLVVLSACSTAVVPGSASSNPSGLVGAFLSAGATEVVASRWNVDSSKTSALMRSFYRNFLARSSAGLALRLAQEEIRSSEPNLHPFYWASFQAFERR